MEDNQVNTVLELNSADAMSFTLEIAGVGVRTYAFLIDWHVRLLIAIVWIYLSAWLFYDLNIFQTMFEEDTANATAAWVIFLPAFIVYFFYHLILESVMNGSTYGKRKAGVRLVTLEGHSTSLGNIFIRNIFRLIDSLPGLYTVGLVVAIITKHHVRIGDLAAGTVLVYDKEADKRKLSEMAQQSIDSNLSADDYDLLLELIERWKQLNNKQRIQLGNQFLKKIGDGQTSDNQKVLLKHLKELV